jgi:protein-disulfide isomerase
MTNARASRSTREKAAEMRAEAERTAARRKAVITGVAVLAVILLAVGTTVLVRSLQRREREREAASVAPPANLHTGVSAVGGGLLVGKGSAKVTVDVYEDFICPACRQFEDASGATLKKYADAGQIALVFHPVSILDRASSTRYSTRAANAMAAVINSSPAAAKTYHDILFANQPPEGGPGLPDSTLLELAEKAGANRAAIEPLVTSLRFEGWVSGQTEKFSKAFPPGSTPTVAVNGRQQKDPSPAALASAIEAALKQ